MKSLGRWLWEWTKSIVVALVVWFFLRTFFVEAFRIPSGSMEKTLLVGDFLFVNKLLYGAEIPLTHKHLPAIREPRRGDILVFDSVEEEGLKVVKRLVGVTGDTLAMQGGVLYRNGAKIDEPWAVRSDPTAGTDPAAREQMRRWQAPHIIAENAEGYHPDANNWGPLVVPRDSFFMMGDNRDDSYDGRYWGFLPRSSVRGRPLVVYFSFDPNTYKPLPFFTNVRWKRLFTMPK
ncbi:MAG: signal peptidase I [Gemmatimonadota bacterium]